MLDFLVSRAPFFLLVAVRCFALISTVPLLSTQTVPRVAKIALAGYTAFLVLPHALTTGWNVAPYGIEYILLILGEVLIGLLTGFYVSLIFSAFSSAGQFFTYQMGFGASEVYDSLAQVENPIMGQYLNLVAMLLFLQIGGFQTLFLGGILRSFEAMNSLSLVTAREHFYTFFLNGLTELFFSAMLIALPMVGTLFLISVGIGILSKAAPQMNLLSEGLPITILTAFFLLSLLLPVMADYFMRAFGIAFYKLEQLLISVSGGIK